MERLVFVEFLGKIGEGSYSYRMYYSENPDIVWGLDWDVYGPVNCVDVLPEMSTISNTYEIVLRLPLKTIGMIPAYSIEYCTYGMIALAWIDIENLEVYPEEGRCVLHFGMEKEKVQKLTEPFKII